MAKVDFQFWTGFYPSSALDCYSWASDKAYLDLARTLRFGNSKGQNHTTWRDSITAKITAAITGGVTQGSFDVWHKELCDSLTTLQPSPASLTVGQAQKWINMTLKYLWLLWRIDVSYFGRTPTMLTDQAAKDFIDKNGKFFHVPLDSYILQWAAGTPKSGKKPFPKNGNGLKKAIPNPFANGWSKINSYDIYLKYQNDLSNGINNSYANSLEWELENWMLAAIYYN